MVVPVGVIFSLIVALLVSGNTLFNKLVRVVYYLPVICSMTAIGIMWAVLLDPAIGMFAYWLRVL